MLAPATRLIVPPHIHVQELDGETVFLNLQNRHYFGLDKVGTRMWHVLTASVSIEAAYEVLLAEYDVEPERLRQDLDNLVEKLVTNGLAASGPE